MTVLFWMCAVMIVYTYLGYPLLLWLLSRILPRDLTVETCTPTVSLIIAAYNEERVIRDKLVNSLALRYPRERLEIIVVADGSTDGTVAIAREFADDGIQVMHAPERRGKTSALNRAVARCSGDVLFFSDANTVYSADTIQTLVRGFSDRSVGGVSGRKIILEDAERVATEGEVAYWSYEAFLKTCESRIGSIVTADGEIFAMRRSLFEPMPSNIVHDDMYLTLSIVRRGFRVVYDNDATSAEYASKSLRDEFHLKVRYASAGLQIVSVFRGLLFPPRSLFAVTFLSHKLLRWTAPLFLVGTLVSSFFAPGPFYRVAFWTQAAFYAAALIGWALHARTRLRLLYFPLYFTMGNAAALSGLVKYAVVGQSTRWRRAER